MQLANKSALTITLVAIAAFCVFGFLATFEPPGFLAFRWGYGILGAASLFAIAAIWRTPTTRR